ncbi:hypothetical protein RCH22_001552 [Cryobacterium psychrotolerans]|nr:hypothetical protein [Cryobacterium psychrotolerans]
MVPNYVIALAITACIPLIGYTIRRVRHARKPTQPSKN